MAVDWNADGMEVWREEAKKEQQACLELLGKPMWREFEPSHYGDLKKEIGYELFGVPEEEPSVMSNDGTGYTYKKLKEINNMFDIIKKSTKSSPNPNKICVSFLFVFGKTRDACIKIPVIRMLQYDITHKKNTNIFIDSCGRVYKNWKDYLDNNTIPDCVLCYPLNGEYSAVNKTVEVEFRISPAGQGGAKMLQSLDKTGTALSMGATGILTVGMFVPVALPLVAGAFGLSILTGGYSAGRNIQTLVDRVEHQQSIGLDSAVSRNCWLGIGGFAFSVGTMVAASKAAKADAPLPSAQKSCIKTFAVGSCVINGLAVINGFANIIDKARNKESITALDAFQLTSTVLFFTHSVISTHQAMSLINSIAEDTSRGSSVDLRDVMNRISTLGAQTKTCNRFPLVISGFLPNVLMFAESKGYPIWSVCSNVGSKLFEITKSWLKDRIEMRMYMMRFRGLLGQIWLSWNKEMDEVVDLICRAFGVKHWSELVTKGCKLIESDHIREMANTLIAAKSSLVDCGNTAKSPHQKEAVFNSSASVGTDDGPNNLVDEEIQNYEFYYYEIANIFVKFVNQGMYRDPEDFCKIMRYVCKFVKVQFQAKKEHYVDKWKNVKDYCPDVKLEDFKNKNGISGNPNIQFLQEVFNELSSEEKVIITSPKKEEDDGQICLNAGGVRFYPFYSMRGLASNGLPSEQQYREIATKLTGRRADTDSISMSANGDTAVIQVNAEADVIMVRCWEEDGKVSGIAAILRTPSE